MTIRKLALVVFVCSTCIAAVAIPPMPAAQQSLAPYVPTPQQVVETKPTITETFLQLEICCQAYATLG